MINLKKMYCDELLQLALILSFLRVDPSSYLGLQTRRVGISTLDIGNDTYADFIINTRVQVHPKNLDSVLLNYQHDIFEELNTLGRYNRIDTYNNITAYLLNVNGSTDDTNTNVNVTVESAVSPDPGSVAEAAALPNDDNTFNFDELLINLKDEQFDLSSELTEEDADLIEVLWKQDVDLGFTLNTFNLPKEEIKKEVGQDDLEKLQALEELKNTSLDDFDNVKEEASSTDLDPWAGLDYTIDLETGEYVLKDDIVDQLDIKDEIEKDLGIKDEVTSTPSAGLDEQEPTTLVGDLAEESELLIARLPTDDDETSVSGAGLPYFSLEEALRLVDLDENNQELVRNRNRLLPDSPDTGVDRFSDDGDDNFFKEMIQTAQFHPPHAPHPRSFQGRMQFARTISMEQRWQDLANLLSLPGQEGVGMHHPFAHHPHHPHHHHHHHGNYTTGHNYTHDSRGVLLHNATLAPPMGDLNNTSPYSNPTMGGSNLGSAVATSMNLTNSTDAGPDTSATGYKMEGSHDLMYYQNSTSEMNQTTEGFLSSILNDEDLQLMDMAMTEGMYTMRMLDNNSSNNGTNAPPVTTGHTEERLDASSDSAVSSMGSERVPSLSDGEWMETGSDSGHTTGDHYNGGLDYHSSKFRPFDYSYNGRQMLGASASASGTADGHIPPVAQKKHQMFGKRYLQEQGSAAGTSLGPHRTLTNLPPVPAPIKYEYETGSEPVVTSGYNGTLDQACAASAKMSSEVKYSCSLDFIRHQPPSRGALDHIHHNHSYPLPSEGSIAMVRPSHRDKSSRGRKPEDEHITRDEKRARSMNIPMTVEDIINLPMDEFNERLSKYDLSEAQLSLIRDIRRRGKNKVAAQNCRKRKLDQIVSLADEVKQMRDRKHRLLRDREYMLSERHRIKTQFSQLYRHVFESLRDADGNQYSPHEYSLQQSADGTVVLVPRSTANNVLQQQQQQQDNSRTKHKDQHDPTSKE